ncbi:MAG: sugar phosphate isomerase/epimerase family protein, partial [Chthoniobacterales bacterium]
MTSWPIGLSTGCFYHRNILDCLPLIRENGFSMVEVCSSPEHLDFSDLKSVHRAAQRIKDLGMEAYSFHAPFAPNIDIASSDPAQRVTSLAEIFKAAEAAALLRVHYFVLHPGPENPAAVSPEEQLPRMQHVVESLNHVARR